MAPGRDASSGSLLGVAAALDKDDWATAQGLICGLGLAGSDDARSLLALSLWRRLVRVRMRGGHIDSRSGLAALKALDGFGATLSGGGLWRAIGQLDTVAASLGQEAVAGLILGVLGDRLAQAHHGFQYTALTHVFLGGSTAQLTALWRCLLAGDASFTPDYWQFQSLFKVLSQNVNTPNLAIDDLLTETKRHDLNPLIAVYLAFLHRRDIGAAFDKAEDLVAPQHRHCVADFLIGASLTNAMLPRAVECHARLAQPDKTAQREFMLARLAVLREDWPQVLALTRPLVTESDLKHPAICLRALAMARSGATREARNALDHIRFDEKTPWYLKGRAALINVTIRAIERGAATPDHCPAPALRLRAGRPLAQSLWIGPRLRWVEDMSIRSFLLNGWRYQLYVYDAPQDVPDGVELMDATAILPRSEMFFETATSGMHKGSLGAFSDLFRYALLARRGGLWTDTDVINLDPFEPDGARFVSSEYTDAGLIGPNGAMMALPAGDTFVLQALDRARNLLSQGKLHFARIGPELIAELLGDGADGVSLMPTDFLNPIGWMETAVLLNRFDAVAARLAATSARNLHVYTETWRLIGLGLSAPPAGAGFLATLHDRIRNASGAHPPTIRSMIRGAEAK